MPIPRVEYLSGDGETRIFQTKGPILTGTDTIFVDGPIVSRSGYSVNSGDRKTVTFSVPPEAGTTNIAIRYFEADS